MAKRSPWEILPFRANSVIVFGSLAQIVPRFIAQTEFLIPLKTIPDRSTKVRSYAFSLLETLTVLAVVALLLALVAPNAATLAPVRKTALFEVKGFLEYARSEAIARDSEVYVAFANESFPGRSTPFRSYAAFAAVDDSGSDSDSPVDVQEIIPISEWKTLPEGTVFVPGSEFETVAGADLRTILDSTTTRKFAVRGTDGDTEVDLPYLLFNASGRVLIPSYFEADALHVGIAEGGFDRSSGQNAPQLTAKRPGLETGREYAQAECLAIEYYTGRTRTLTD